MDLACENITQTKSCPSRQNSKAKISSFSLAIHTETVFFFFSMCGRTINPTSVERLHALTFNLCIRVRACVCVHGVCLLACKISVYYWERYRCLSSFFSPFPLQTPAQVCMDDTMMNVYVWMFICVFFIRSLHLQIDERSALNLQHLPR